MAEYAGQKKVSKDIARKINRAETPSAKKAAEKKRKMQRIYYFAKLLKKNEAEKIKEWILERPSYIKKNAYEIGLYCPHGKDITDLEKGLKLAKNQINKNKDHEEK